MAMKIRVRDNKRISVIKKLEAGTGIQAQNSCRRCPQRRAAEESSDRGGIAIEACGHVWFPVQRSVEEILEHGVMVLVLMVMAPEPRLMVMLWMLAVAV